MKSTASSRRRLRNRAEALASMMAESELEASAMAAIRACPPGEPVAIACSGGADSVALLLLLWTHLPERRRSWLVLHFDHRWRGRASTMDAAFVQRLARALGERCEVGRWSDPPVRPTEAAARAVRWTFFDAAMRRAGARVIALGHQLDDVAETMLMRLVRGSGTDGLAAPRPVQVRRDGSVRVRPLLGLSAATLRGALRQARLRWREDVTNATGDFLRNRVRRDVLPALLEASDRDALAGIGLSRRSLEDDGTALDAWLAELIDAPCRDSPCDLGPLRGKPIALARRAVYRWLLEVGGAEPPARPAVDALCAAIVGGRTHRTSWGARDFLVLRGGVITLEAGPALAAAAPWPFSHLEPGREIIGPRGDRLRAQRVRLTPRLWQRIRAGAFPQAAIVHLAPPEGWPGHFSVRSWQPGDRYRPLGTSGRRKVQDLFVDHGVPRELRPLLPVITMALDNREILVWIPGLRVADAVGIQPTAKLVVQLTYVAVPPR